MSDKKGNESPVRDAAASFTAAIFTAGPFSPSTWSGLSKLMGALLQDKRWSRRIGCLLVGLGVATSAVVCFLAAVFILPLLQRGR